MNYTIHQTGESRSFPAGDRFLDKASTDAILVFYLG